MKIAKSRLRQIIREELTRSLLRETTSSPSVEDDIEDIADIAAQNPKLDNYVHRAADNLSPEVQRQVSDILAALNNLDEADDSDIPPEEIDTLERLLNTGATASGVAGALISLSGFKNLIEIVADDLPKSAMFNSIILNPGPLDAAGDQITSGGGLLALSALLIATKLIKEYKKKNQN